MDEMTIRRNREAAAPRYPAVEKAEKTSGGQRIASKAGITASGGLERLLTRVSQAEGQIRESHRTLLAGETALAEVRESLERIGKLVQEAAGEKGIDRDALQAEVERLREDIDRMLGSAAYGGEQLFLEGEEAGAAADAAAAEAASRQKTVQGLPDWLVRSLTQIPQTPEELLHALGLDKSASGSELLAAVMNYPLNGNSTVDYLAALYLGAVIAGGASPRAVSPEEALAGLRQLLEKVAEGGSLDESIAQLSNGAFTSMADFQSQFTSGVALDLREFLVELLLSGSSSAVVDGAALLTLLDGEEGMKLELMMGLLEAAQTAKSGSEEAQSSAEATTGGLEELEAAGSGGGSGIRGCVMTLEGAQVLGRDLSGVSYDEAAGVLTAGGSGDVVIQGTGQGFRAIVVAGSGTVTLQNVRVSLLEAAGPEVQVHSSGENELDEVRLRRDVQLTLGGSGLLRIAALRGEEGSVLRQTGGAVVLPEGEDKAPLAVPVVLDGPVSLAAQVGQVTNPDGKPLSPFDIVWKTLLPGWSAVTAMEVDGRQVRMLLHGGVFPEAARLWLEKGDPSHGSPIHAVVIRGKDASGRPKTRYAYLHWSRRAWGFEEISMYPNPFTVTGGEEGQDWVYEEGTQTLFLLSGQVLAVSGGMGLDGRQAPFSGRIVLDDGIGPMTLTLEGIVCRVEEGRAFDVGRGNAVTLCLRSGSENCFSSGEGCAGISLGEGSCLEIDCPDARQSGRNPAGSLSASGSGGGAGIGRDSGTGKDQTSRIVIRGGMVAASGSGGGAGIGAGKDSFMGPLALLGGTVSAAGGIGGGAGIGGGKNGTAGDIQIRGGRISATAADHAAAIGAGVQGPCGDILITGTARIVKARGGDPGADIGSCLFGGCGKVLISGGADIGKAGLSTQSGIPLRMGGETVTLPQFRLSSRALGLHRLDLSTREGARSAQAVLDADRRWIERIQVAYGALYHRLEKNAGGLQTVHRCIDAAEGLLRDSSEAGSLLRDTRQSIALPSSQAMRTHGGQETEDVELLFR